MINGMQLFPVSVYIDIYLFSTKIKVIISRFIILLDQLVLITF